MSTSSTFSPRETVSELDKYIIGQDEAKKAVAIALRNRWRRMQLPDRLKEEIVPKNILMVGPTGVGKTEISRRLAKLAKAPFIKVEATKFTEIGYVGRDVESIIRDLLEIALNETRKTLRQKYASRLKKEQKNALLKLWSAPLPAKKPNKNSANCSGKDSSMIGKSKFLCSTTATPQCRR